MTKKLNLAPDEVAVVPAVAPPELDFPPMLEAPPEAEVPPATPPFELLDADVPPELVPVVPPDFDELLLVVVPPDDTLVPPELDAPPELDVPPELEAPPELDFPPELLPPDELALLLLAPPDDAPPEEDDDVWLDPLCPPLELPLPLDPPELLLEPFCADPASSAPHPPRAGIRIREEPNKIVHESLCFCFLESIYNILPPRKTRHA
jgi:hypothetical protein